MMEHFAYIWWREGPGKIMWCVKCEDPCSEYEYNIEHHMCYNCFMKEYVRNPNGLYGL